MFMTCKEVDSDDSPHSGSTEKHDWVWIAQRSELLVCQLISKSSRQGPLGCLG
jgi:hypothetical protein